MRTMRYIDRYIGREGKERGVGGVERNEREREREYMKEKLALQAQVMTHDQ